MNLEVGIVGLVNSRGLEEEGDGMGNSKLTIAHDEPLATQV